MKFVTNIDDYEILNERLNWLQNQIEELQAKVEDHDEELSSKYLSIPHRIINEKSWKSKRRHQFVDARDIKPAAIILTRSILQFLSPGPVSEKDLRVSTANRCKDLGVKITGKGGVAGESMDVFTVCNVLQAIGVLEDATINPPSTTPNPTPKEPSAPTPPSELNDPTSPQPSLLSPKLIHPDNLKPTTTTLISPPPLLTPNQSISILSASEIRDRGPTTASSDLSQILRSSTPILPISFDHVGECLTPGGTQSLPNASLPNQKCAEENKMESSATSLLSPQVNQSSSLVTSPDTTVTQSPRATYGAQVESSLTARWEKQLRDYLKDLRCRKISHIMGRESYHAGGAPNSTTINSRGVNSANRTGNPSGLARALPSSSSSLPPHSFNPNSNPISVAQSLDDEDFEEDDETVNNSQSTTPPPTTPIGIAVPGLSINVPSLPSSSSLQSKPNPTTPRDSSSAMSSVLPIPKITSPAITSLQTGILSPTGAVNPPPPPAAVTAALVAAAVANAVPVKEKKPVMRRFTGSTRGGWTFPTPLTTSSNELGPSGSIPSSPYDVFLHPQEVLAKWSQICYEEN